MQSEIIGLFKRDLDRLLVECDQYTDHQKLWVRSGSISNPAGNLILHICGNLNHFIGKILGGTGYERDREAEFAQQNLPHQQLRQIILKTDTTVTAVLSSLKEEDLVQPYPVEIAGLRMSVSSILIHLLGHLNYHLGQINYHRRLQS